MTEMPGLALDLVESAFEAAVAPDRWGRFLDALAAPLGARTLCLVLGPPRDSAVCHSIGIAPEFERTSLHRVLEREPWRELVAGLTEGAITSNGALHDALKGSEFQRGWMAPQGLEHPLLAVLDKVDGECRASLLAFRSPGEGPFAPEGLALLERLIPHLRRALSVHRELRTAESVRNAALATLDRIPEGWIALGSDATVLATNRKAREILDRGDGLAVDQGRLVVADPAPAERLRQMLARAGDGPLAGGTIELPGTDGTPLRAVAAPLQGRGFAAVLFIDPAPGGGEQEAQRLRETYGLTHAEARVAGRLAQGQRLSEIARDLGISINTVRGHLKQVFAKTGTHRQAELVRLVLSGPSEIQVAAS